MSKAGTWTVVFNDRVVVKRTGEFNASTARGYICGDDSFWTQDKFSNLHAIQFTDDNTDNDQVEFKDSSPNGIYDAATYGNFSQFITIWDAAHLTQLQSDWDNNVLRDADGVAVTETEAEKITRLGARPTSYSS